MLFVHLSNNALIINFLSVFNNLIYNSHRLNKKCAPLLLTPILALRSDVKHGILTNFKK